MAIDLSSLTGSDIASAANLLGGLLSSSAQADATTAAAQQAAQAQQFRPIGITSRFGASGFNYDPTTGQVVGAGYTAAPDVAAMREAMMTLAPQQLQQVQAAQAFQPITNQAAMGLFNLGQQYVAETPQQAAQNWMSQQQAMLAPSREQQLANVYNKNYRLGTSGLATGATEAGGMGASNPLMQAYANANAQQDLQLAAQAQQQGMNQATAGQNLMTGGLNLATGGYGLQSSALQPYTNYIQAAQNLENLAAAPLQTGAGLGSSITAGSTNAAGTMQTGQNTANALNASALNNLISGIGTGLGGMLSNNYNSTTGLPTTAYLNTLTNQANQNILNGYPL